MPLGSYRLSQNLANPVVATSWDTYTGANDGSVATWDSSPGGFRVIRLTDDKFVIVYSDVATVTTTGYFKAVIGSVSGNSISFGTPTNILQPSANTSLQRCWLHRVSDTRFVFYRTGFQYVVCDVSGTSISIANTAVTSTTGNDDATPFRIVALSDTKWVTIGRTTAGGWRTNLSTISGTTMSTATPVNIAPTGGTVINEPFLYYIDSNYFMITGSDRNNTREVEALIINTTSGSPSAVSGSSVTLDLGAGSTNNLTNVCPVYRQPYAVEYQTWSHNQSGILYFRTVKSTTSAITWNNNTINWTLNTQGWSNAVTAFQTGDAVFTSEYDFHLLLVNSNTIGQGWNQRLFIIKKDSSNGNPLSSGSSMNILRSGTNVYTTSDGEGSDPFSISLTRLTNNKLLYVARGARTSSTTFGNGIAQIIQP